MIEVEGRIWIFVNVFIKYALTVVHFVLTNFLNREASQYFIFEGRIDCLY